MAKISQSLGFTFRLGSDPRSNQYGKVSLEISEIDTTLPIEPQLEEVKKGLDAIWKFIYAQVDKEVEKVLEK